jgi:hypothetical protein
MEGIYKNQKNLMPNDERQKIMFLNFYYIYGLANNVLQLPV